MGGDSSRWRVHVKTSKIPAVWAELVWAGLRYFKCATTREATFLLDVLETKEFRAGGVDTQWLDRYMARRPAAPPDAAAGLVAAAILAYQRARRSVRFYFYADPSSVSPAQVPASAGQRIDLSLRISRWLSRRRRSVRC